MSSINNRNPPLPPAGQTPRDIAEAERAEALVKKEGGGAKGTRSALQAEKQQAESAAQAPLPRKMSVAEQERLLAQMGFVRNRRRGGATELDENSVRLPIEDVDEAAWEQDRLNDAQEKLTLESHALKQLIAEVGEEGPGEHGVFGRLIAGAFTPTPEGLAALETLANGEPPAPISMQAVSKNIQALFGINVESVDNGQAMVAAALVVAGHGDAVKAVGESLDPEPLCRGMQEVIENSSSAVDDARGMSSGIHKQIAAHRTFVFKR